MAADNLHKSVQIGQKWLERIRDAEKREEAWRKQAARAEAIYLNRTDNGAHKFFFNILHSNVETIVPAIYSATPRPDIRRRFGDKDPVASTAATMLERAILVQIDDGVLDPEIESIARDSYTAGRGLPRIRLVEEDAETGEIEDETRDEAKEAALYDSEGGEEAAADDGEDDPIPEAGDMLGMGAAPTMQRVTYESVPWNDFRFGSAKRWEHVPWVAFRHTITADEIKSWSKSPDVQNQIKSVSKGALDDEAKEGTDCEVWEVWCKASKTVKFIRQSDAVIFKEVDDPLGLTGFFPCPRPLQPIERNGDLTPVAPFNLYADLAEELDQTTRRIQKLIEGVKVCGGAAAGELLKGIQDIAALGDNEIAEIRGVEAFAQQGGLEKGITWWPIEKSIEAIGQLAAHRDQIKATIYEVTGISDIVRGASNAQETATAQQIKSQWGSLRIQRMQRLIERCVRELFVMTAELIATRFTPETIQAITLLPYTPEVDAIFKSRVSRFYRIDVETDSTIKADMSKSKAEMTQFLAGTAQYIQAIGPAVQQGMIPPKPAIDIYASFARTFRLGKNVEDALQSLADEPQGPQVPPEVQQQMQQGMEIIQQLQQELAKAQQEAQAAKAENAAMKADERVRMDEAARKTKLDERKLDIDFYKAETDRMATDHTIETSNRETTMAERERDPALVGAGLAETLGPAMSEVVSSAVAETVSIVVPQIIASLPPQKVKIPRVRRVPVRDNETGLIQYTIDEPIEDEVAN
jgi:hypothetical protein